MSAATTPPYPHETYYRVSLKALIFDDQKRLLIFKDDGGTWEIPGGGWDHDEDYQECLRRELAEEADLKLASIGSVAFFHRGESQHGHPKISLAFPVTLMGPRNFSSLEEGLVEARYVSKQEFLQLPFQQGEASVQQHADDIWRLVEKNSEDR